MSAEIEEFLNKHAVCLGYMDKDDFCMFVNENYRGREGGFSWDFQDYKPDNLDDYRKIIILRFD